MRPLFQILVALSAAAVSANAAGVEIPRAVHGDPRLREVVYDANQVFEIRVKKGVATQIVFGKGEQITSTAPGIGADCKDEKSTWCIVANKGEDRVFVKPKYEAEEDNNLELVTNKRTYSFEFTLIEEPTADSKKVDAKRAAKAVPKARDDRMFRVTFRYPDEEAALKAEAAKKLENEVKLAEKLSEEPIPRNWNYSKQELPGSREILPSLIFDDGRFTYLSFPANRKQPEVFEVQPDGSEKRVAKHIQGDYVVVHLVARHLVLRLDKAVVSVWNEAFNPDGIAPRDGTTIEGLKRVARSKNDE